MPIQVEGETHSFGKVAAAAVVMVVIIFGIILATNWQAFALVIAVLAAAGGYWLAR